MLFYCFLAFVYKYMHTSTIIIIITQVLWKRGWCLAWNATSPNTLAQSYIQDSSSLAGSAALAAELSKIAKYSDITACVDFIPFVSENFGVWAEQAMSLVKNLGRRMAEVNKEPRSTTFLRERLSVAVQSGNAACILGTLSSVVGCSY